MNKSSRFHKFNPCKKCEEDQQEWPKEILWVKRERGKKTARFSTYNHIVGSTRRGLLRETKHIVPPQLVYL